MDILFYVFSEIFSELRHSEGGEGWSNRERVHFISVPCVHFLFSFSLAVSQEQRVICMYVFLCRFVYLSGLCVSWLHASISESAFDEWCFGETLRDRKWVMCGGDSSLQACLADPAPLKSDTAQAFPFVRSHLPLPPLHPLIRFSIFTAESLRPGRKATVLHHCWQSPVRYIPQILLLPSSKQKCSCVFPAYLLCVCRSHEFSPMQNMLIDEHETWTTDHLPHP